MLNPMRYRESGNVLFLILIAVALFAALSFVVTSSARNSGGTVDGERDVVFTGAVAQYPLMIRAGVLRITTTEHDTEISFDSPNWSHARYQHAPAQPDENNVFHPDGSGVPWQIPDPKWLDSAFSGQPEYGNWLFTSTTCVPGLGIGNDSSCSGNGQSMDLLAILPYIKLSLCKEINKRFRVNTSNGGTPPQDQGDTWDNVPEFNGQYVPGDSLIDAANVLYSVDAGCFEGNGTPPAGSYHFYTAILNR